MWIKFIAILTQISIFYHGSCLLLYTLFVPTPSHAANLAKQTLLIITGLDMYVT